VNLSGSESFLLDISVAGQGTVALLDRAEMRRIGESECDFDIEEID
jgi:hypothetical protein